MKRKKAGRPKLADPKTIQVAFRISKSQSVSLKRVHPKVSVAAAALIHKYTEANP